MRLVKHMKDTSRPVVKMRMDATARRVEIPFLQVVAYVRPCNFISRLWTPTMNVEMRGWTIEGTKIAPEKFIQELKKAIHHG